MSKKVKKDVKQHVSDLYKKGRHIKKKDPVEHEKKYIEFLEKQIAWKEKQPNGTVSKEEMNKLKLKLSKARLVLKILTS